MHQDSPQSDAGQGRVGLPPPAVTHGLAQMSAQAVTVGAPAPVPNAQAILHIRALAEKGMAFFNQGNFLQALALFDEALKQRPDDAEFHYKVGWAAWRANQFHRVQAHFLRAAALEPDHAAIHEALASWFSYNGEIPQALKHSARAMALLPTEPQYIITHADVLAADGQAHAAWHLIEPLLKSQGVSAWLARVYASIAVKLGHESQAFRYVHRALQIPNLLPMDRIRLQFAATRLLDGLGKYDDAFEYARRANQGSTSKFNPTEHLRLISTWISYFTKSRLKSLPRATNTDRRPLLIVGMPRSGTSLVEQIFASHAAVSGGGELTDLSQATQNAASAHWCAGEPFPQCFDHLTLRRADQLASQYIATLNRISTSALRVTDKMPENFNYLATAQLLLPGCRIIHCTRDPRDTCLSCYFTDFGGGKEFSHNLAHMAEYYRSYDQLMAHWKQVLDVPVLDVSYEQVVSDPREQTRRMLDFAGLSWDEQCMKFHENSRHVATASRDQVRRPIYASSVGRWKNYQAHLGPILELAAAG